jgi:hypothetical protein
MTTTYEKIATNTLSSAQASVTLSSIPSDYTDLVLVVNGKTNGFGGYNALSLRVNSDSGSNYSRTIIYGGNGFKDSYSYSNETSTFVTIGQQADAFGNAIVNFNNYSNTTTHKPFLGRDNYSTNVVYATVSLWRNTSAITSITLSGTGGHDIVSGSTFNLYGIKAE